MRCAQVLIGSTELLTPERALQRLHCAPLTEEDLEYEMGTLEGSIEPGAGAEAELSALDACFDKIPLEKIFPCCFRSEVRIPRDCSTPIHGVLLRCRADLRALNLCVPQIETPLVSQRWGSQSDAEDRPLVTMNP